MTLELENIQSRVTHAAQKEIIVALSKLLGENIVALVSRLEGRVDALEAVVKDLDSEARRKDREGILFTERMAPPNPPRGSQEKSGLSPQTGPQGGGPKANPNLIQMRPEFMWDRIYSVLRQTFPKATENHLKRWASKLVKSLEEADLLTRAEIAGTSDDSFTRHVTGISKKSLPIIRDAFPLQKVEKA